MKFEIGQINPKDHEGNLVFLYGTVVADRSLPLSKKELDYLKTCRVNEPDTIVVFDRLPYKLFIVNFDSELDADQCQERLRRSAAKVVDMLRNAKTPGPVFHFQFGNRLFVAGEKEADDPNHYF